MNLLHWKRCVGVLLLSGLLLGASFPAGAWEQNQSYDYEAAERFYQEGMDYFKEGEYSKATNSFRGAAELLEGNYSNENTRVLKQLGAMYEMQGKLKNAAGVYDIMLAIQRTLYLEGDKKVRYIDILNTMLRKAHVEYEMGRYDRAEDLLESAQAAIDEYHPELKGFSNQIERELAKIQRRRTARH